MSHTCRGCGLTKIPNKAALRQHFRDRPECTDIIEEKYLGYAEAEVGLEGLNDFRKPISPLAKAIVRNRGGSEL